MSTFDPFISFIIGGGLGFSAGFALRHFGRKLLSKAGL